jgi:Putative polyhydroxyalkanoic acid system protein (PHA_gran_rgn)
MAKINAAFPYQISQDEALSRIKSAIDNAKTQYGSMVTNFRENWNGYVGTFSGSAQGHSVSGTITVDPGVVNVELEVPAIAILAKGKIVGELRNRLGPILA